MIKSYSKPSVALFNTEILDHETPRYMCRMITIISLPSHVNPLTKNVSRKESTVLNAG